MGYDKLNRLKAVTNTVAGASAVTSRMSYQYDPVGNRSGASVGIGATTPILSSYQYDAAERLEKITTSSGGQTLYNVYTYKPENGALATVSYLNTCHIVTSYEYDLLDRITNITYIFNITTGTPPVIRSIDYDYYEDTSMIKDKTKKGSACEI